MKAMCRRNCCALGNAPKAPAGRGFLVFGTESVPVLLSLSHPDRIQCFLTHVCCSAHDLVQDQGHLLLVISRQLTNLKRPRLVLLRHDPDEGRQLVHIAQQNHQSTVAVNDILVGDRVVFRFFCLQQEFRPYAEVVAGCNKLHHSGQILPFQVWLLPQELLPAPLHVFPLIVGVNLSVAFGIVRPIFEYSGRHKFVRAAAAV
mmetsp:Transcript_19255/g.58121  ORF Transcript_19255/g.58121 Transcript_19255/m.58121 type:complete len:202 (+) Transcript_19255:557-1162(+)